MRLSLLIAKKIWEIFSKSLSVTINNNHLLNLAAVKTELKQNILKFGKN